MRTKETITLQNFNKIKLLSIILVAVLDGFVVSDLMTLVTFFVGGVNVIVLFGIEPASFPVKRKMSVFKSIRLCYYIKSLIKYRDVDFSNIDLSFHA